MTTQPVTLRFNNVATTQRDDYYNCYHTKSLIASRNDCMAAVSLTTTTTRNDYTVIILSERILTLSEERL